MLEEEEKEMNTKNKISFLFQKIISNVIKS